MDIKEELKQLILNNANCDTEKNLFDEENTCKLFEDLGYDSISTINLIAEIEEKFNINIDDDEFLEAIQGVNYLHKLVVDKVCK